jgi:hypothetical protein
VGYALDDVVVREGDDREIVAEFLAAREITQAVEQGKDVDPGDIQDDRALPLAARLPARRTPLGG